MYWLLHKICARKPITKVSMFLTFLLIMNDLVNSDIAARVNIWHVPFCHESHNTQLEETNAQVLSPFSHYLAAYIIHTYYIMHYTDMYSLHQCEILCCLKSAHLDHANELSFSSCCHVYPGHLKPPLFTLVCPTPQRTCLVLLGPTTLAL